MSQTSKENIGAITSKEWEGKLKNVDIKEYKAVTVADKDASHIANYKPSDLLVLGDYPFSN